MTAMFNMERKWVYWLIGMTACILFFRLGAAPIYILDEAKNAECAREMMLRHDWIVPTFNGQLRTDKPVLHYWFMMLSYEMFGVNAFAARFFSVVMGIGTLLLTYGFTARWVNRSVASFSTLVLALSAQFLFEFRLSVPDPYLIFFTAAGLFSGYSYLQTRSWKWLTLTAVSLALATLAKGPVALALPGMCMLLYMVSYKRWSDIFDVRYLVAAIIYVSIAAPWYVAVHKATNGAWTKGFFLEHNLDRFSTEMEGHGGPFIITPLIVIIGLLPLGAFIFAALRKKVGIWQSPFSRFSLVVTLMYVVFFSISSTKLPNYPMPCYPFVAIIIGHWIHRLMNERRPIPVYALIILLIVATSLPIGGWLALRNETETASLAVHAWWLSFLPLCLCLLFLKRNQWEAFKVLKGIAVLYTVFNILFITILYPMVYQRNPVTTSLTTIDKADMRFIAYQDLNAAMLFNLPEGKHLIPVVEDSAKLRSSIDSMAQNGTGKVYVVTRKDRLASLDTNSFLRVVSMHHDLFENPTTVILEKK